VCDTLVFTINDITRTMHGAESRKKKKKEGVRLCEHSRESRAKHQKQLQRVAAASPFPLLFLSLSGSLTSMLAGENAVSNEESTHTHTKKKKTQALCSARSRRL
jgi:hypothetical protein